MLGRPLISYAVEAALSSQSFHRVYVNSESEELGAVALSLGADFYKRDETLSGDAIKNENFVCDFLKHIETDYLFMVNPTSPLLTSEDIRLFVGKMLAEKYDSMFAVRAIRAQSFIDGRPINFNTDAPHVSSQDLPVIESICWAITGWNAATFMNTYREKGYGAYCGKIGTFRLPGFASLDIDYEEDFQLAEALMQLEMEKKNAVGSKC